MLSMRYGNVHEACDGCLTKMIRLQLIFFQRMLGSHRNDGLVGA